MPPVLRNVVRSAIVGTGNPCHLGLQLLDDAGANDASSAQRRYMGILQTSLTMLTFYEFLSYVTKCHLSYLQVFTKSTKRPEEAGTTVRPPK